MDPTLTRDELLEILKTMGLEIPASTTLPDAALERRLLSALDASQHRTRLPPHFNLMALKRWPLATPGELDESARSVFDAMGRGNVDEARQIIEAAVAETKRPAPRLYVSPFEDMRQTIMNLAMFLDGGARWSVLQDETGAVSAVKLRMIAVFEINKDTPAIVVLYRHFNTDNVVEGLHWVSDQCKSNAPALGDSVFDITASLLEQKLFLKLLDHNAPLVPPEFPVERGRGEERFKVSLILPLEPLESDMLAKLNEKQACAICGMMTTSRCSQCHLISYCGSACQNADWPAHKVTCRSLKGGQWCTIPFRTALPGLEHAHLKVLTHNPSAPGHGFQYPTTDAAPLEIASTVPPNIWGDKLFTLKFQVGLVEGEPDTMMVYDMMRSFRAFFIRQDAPALFEEFYDEMRGPRGGYGGMKMYRWARRTGDWQFDVCVDREPKTDTKW